MIPSKRIGFSLIELLVVLSIILTLAAIAMVNYQDSLTRARVVRAKADMRTIAIGIESYHVDFNVYPPNPAIAENVTGGKPNGRPTRPGLNVTPFVITTPISYLTSLPVDPFRQGLVNLYDTRERQLRSGEIHYSYYRIISAAEWMDEIGKRDALVSHSVSLIAVDAPSGFAVPYLNVGAFAKYGGWVQWSAGPDRTLWYREDDFVSPGDPLNALKNPPRHKPWGYSFDVPYDPTNGITSFGNIIRTQLGDSKPFSPGSKPSNAITRSGTGTGAGANGSGDGKGNGNRNPNSANRDKGAVVDDAMRRIPLPPEGEVNEIGRVVKERVTKRPARSRPLYDFIYYFQLKHVSLLLLLIALLLLLLAALLRSMRQKEEDRLALNAASVNDSTLIETKGLKKFQRLYLAQSQVTDGGLLHIRDMPKLKSLNLWSTAVTDAGLPHLSHLPALRELVLMDTHVTDAGLASLVSITGLEDLVLSGTQITDAGIETLSKMKGLKNLSLHRVSMTAEAIARLKSALPNCKIVSDFDPPENAPQQQ